MRSAQIADDDDDVVDAALAQGRDLIAKDRLTGDRGQALRTVRRVWQQPASRAGGEDDGGSRDVGMSSCNGFKACTACGCRRRHRDAAMASRCIYSRPDGRAEMRRLDNFSVCWQRPSTRRASMKFSIVIPTYNRAADLRATLAVCPSCARNADRGSSSSSTTTRATRRGRS